MLSVFWTHWSASIEFQENIAPSESVQRPTQLELAAGDRVVDQVLYVFLKKKSFVREIVPDF